MSIARKLLLHFLAKSILVVIIAICGIMMIANTDDTVQRKIENIVDFSELRSHFNETKASYISYVKTSDTLSLKKFNSAYQQLDKNAAFTVFKNEYPEFKPDVEALENALQQSKDFFKNNILQIKDAPKQTLSYQTLVDDNNQNFNDLDSIFGNLIKRQTESLKSSGEQAKSQNYYLGFIVLIAAGISMVLLIVFYYQANQNIRKQKVHDKEIYQAKYAAQVANNAKSEYLAMISHEIRTPMNGVLGMSNLLLQSDLNVEQHDYAHTIHKSAEALLKIVNDVLDFSKIEAGKLNLDNITVNVRTVIEDVFAILPKPNSKIKISYNVDENVPQYISCDPVRLRQVLLNLVGNAIKFTDHGIVQLECKLIDKSENEEIKLGFIVKDSGIGIAEAKIKELFKPFVQADETMARRYGGTGLGLNIAYNLIAMMGGKIKVNSEVNKGSVFTFYIVTKVAVENLKAFTNTNINPNILDNALAASFPFKILVVDDNEINLMLIIKTLSKLGYECKKASNGKIALDIVKEEHFDLIFMDMQMPVMDGTVASTEIRKHYRIYEYPVIIALTANALGDGRDKCLEAGMQDFIAKPFKPAEIEEVIKKWAPKINEYRQKNHSGTYTR